MADNQCPLDPCQGQGGFLGMCTGVPLQEALERVLAMAEAHHMDKRDHPDDHGINAVCLEIVAQHVGGAP